MKTKVPLLALYRTWVQFLILTSRFSILSLPSMQDVGRQTRRVSSPGNAHHNRTFQPCNLLLHLKQKVAIHLSRKHFAMQKQPVKQKYVAGCRPCVDRFLFVL
jgi:hypothetical protein